MKENIVLAIMNELKKKYPAPETALYHSSPFELLIATILSAQSTDKQVNKVTRNLFKKYNTPDDFAKLNINDLEKEINSIGLYKNKSKYIIEASKMIISDYGGMVPERREGLIKLPGVGRKTANVVLASGFNKNAIAVDTHVFRVANRLGLVDADKPYLVEKQLMAIIPEKKWADMHHWLIFHGRETCKARNPQCEDCSLSKYCKYYQEE